MSNNNLKIDKLEEKITKKEIKIECEEIKPNYVKGLDDGIDIDWDWTQCAISRLVNKGKLPENTRDLIFNEVESITEEEFDKWYNIAYPNKTEETFDEWYNAK